MVKLTSIISMVIIAIGAYAYPDVPTGTPEYGYRSYYDNGNSVAPSGELTASPLNDGWSSPTRVVTGGNHLSNLTVLWEITQVGSQFHYIYAIGSVDYNNTPISAHDGFIGDLLSGPAPTLLPLAKDLSHLILQVSDGFTSADFSFAQSEFTGVAHATVGTVDTYSAGGSNPGLPGDIYGIKFQGWTLDNGDPVPDGVHLVNLIEFMSDRAPVWGDFYAKDGTDSVSGDPVYGYNSGFGTTPPEEGSFAFWIPRPDTAVAVPEPCTLLLLSTGFFGALFKRRKKA